MTRSHVFAKAAVADLREITRYTVQQWGVAQARTYAKLIEAAAADLATSRGVFKDLSAIHPGLRSKLTGSHHIFCLLRPDRPALVLAILHERMDLMVRLKSRLHT